MSRKKVEILIDLNMCTFLSLNWLGYNFSANRKKYKINMIRMWINCIRANQIIYSHVNCIFLVVVIIINQSVD